MFFRASVLSLGAVGRLACTRFDTHFAYTFHVTAPAAAAAKPGEPETISDPDLEVQIAVDAVGGAIVLAMKNKTDDVLQVEWNEISRKTDRTGDQASAAAMAATSMSSSRTVAYPATRRGSAGDLSSFLRTAVSAFAPEPSRSGR